MAQKERRYLRSKTDGYIMPYHEELIGHPDLEVITDKEARPERHIPRHIEKRREQRRRDEQKNKPHHDLPQDMGKGLDITGGIEKDTGTEKPAPTDPQLAKQAGKGWPK